MIRQLQALAKYLVVPLDFERLVVEILYSFVINKWVENARRRMVLESVHILGV